MYTETQGANRRTTDSLTCSAKALCLADIRAVKKVYAVINRVNTRPLLRRRAKQNGRRFSDTDGRGTDSKLCQLADGMRVDTAPCRFSLKDLRTLHAFRKGSMRHTISKN